MAGNSDIALGAGSGAASGAMMGAMMGSMTPLGPGLGTAVGAGVGLLGGALGGLGQKSAAKAQAAALRAQQIAQENEMGRRAQGVAAARTRFGDLWSMGAGVGDPALRGDVTRQSFDPASYQKVAQTAANRSQIAGAVEGQAGAVRDVGSLAGANAMQIGARGLRAASGARGLIGSSLLDSQKQALAGQFAQGKSDLAAGVDATRQGGFDAVRQQQAGMERLAGGGTAIGGQLNALNTQGAIAGARAMQPAAAFGNLLNTGIGLLGSAARAEAGGGMGLRALGGPSLGVAPRKSGLIGAQLSGG